MHFSDCPSSCGKPCSRRKVPLPDGYEELLEGRALALHLSTFSSA